MSDIKVTVLSLLSLGFTILLFWFLERHKPGETIKKIEAAALAFALSVLMAEHFFETAQRARVHFSNTAEQGHIGADGFLIMPPIPDSLFMWAIRIGFLLFSIAASVTIWIAAYQVWTRLQIARKQAGLNVDPF